LIAAAITLRLRTGGEDAGWHLKLPAGADTRDEIRLPLAASGGAVPEELAALVRACTGGAALAPVVRIQASRRVLGLLDGSGRVLAEVAADHVWAEPAGGSAVWWDEIGAGLVTGGPELLMAIEARLRRAGARPAATATKLQQLLGDHHDSVVARTVLLDLARKARAAGEDTFTYGLMHQRQACQAATMGQALPRFTAARGDRTKGH